MSHQTNINLKIENITEFSIIDEKKLPIFEIYKGPQVLQTDREDIFQVGPLNPKDFVINRIFSIGLNEVGEQIDYTLKSDNTSYLKDLSNQKLSQTTQKKLLNKNGKIVNNSTKKELTKINKVRNKKKKIKNKLIKPVLFEEEKQTIKNNIQKPKIVEKKVFPIINNFKPINFPSNNLLNFDLSKNFNIIYGNNNLKSPNILITDKIPNNNFVNNTINIKIEKPKSKETKQMNTFNIMKYPKPTLPQNEQKLNNLQLFSTEEQMKEQNSSILNNSFNKTNSTRKGRKAKNCKDYNSESKHTKFSEDNMMRKIKNKIIESSRLLANKLFLEELKEVKEKNTF